MGYAQSGKDTAATFLRDYGYERVAFADPLREMLAAINPLVADTHDPSNLWRLRRLVDVLGWDVAKTEFPEIRGLLQRLGTEAGRVVLGDHIWVDTALRRIEGASRYVFTDVRFPNEAEAIEGRGGVLWRVVRPGTEPVNAHPSETALDGWPAEIIWNGSDLTGLQGAILRALEMS